MDGSKVNQWTEINQTEKDKYMISIVKSKRYKWTYKTETYAHI